MAGGQSIRTTKERMIAGPAWLAAAFPTSTKMPVPMIALVCMTSSREVMGDFASSRFVIVLAVFAAGVVIALNVLLLFLTFGIEIPGLAGDQ